MKKIKNLLQLGCILIVGTSMMLSCEKGLLDQVPKESLTEELVWTDPQGAIQFVNGLYSGLPSGFDRSYDGWGGGLYILDGVTDDGATSSTINWQHSELLKTGNFLPTNVPWGNTWPISYGLIRRANVAIENLDRLDDVELSERLKGEVYFLRAFIYNDLLRLFGLRSSGGEPTGLPLVAKSLTLDDDLQIPRATYAEVVDFMISDLDKAAAALPTKGNIAAGRATVGAAYALQSRIYLYAERWAEAAAAAKKVDGYSLFGDYRTIFLEKDNDEIIFAKKFQFPDKVHQGGGAGWDVWNTPGSFKGASDLGWGGNLPTQNFVDVYDMVDGDSQGTSSLYDANKPFDNLDPRFEATVVHNEATFRGKKIELFEGGSEENDTGYFLRKFHVEGRAIYSQSSDQDWIFLRYAEVLLNYAEGQNEAVGPDATVYQAIRNIRVRAGITAPDLPAGLTKDEMRAKIRKERRIELAFEEHRFFDIRRWRIAVDLLNGPVKGIKIVKEADGTFTYSGIDVEMRSFPEKLYVLPIPQGEIDKNPAAKQINGW